MVIIAYVPLNIGYYRALQGGIGWVVDQKFYEVAQGVGC
jgi:hypothetical protein